MLGDAELVQLTNPPGFTRNAARSGLPQNKLCLGQQPDSGSFGIRLFFLSKDTEIAEEERGNPMRKTYQEQVLWPICVEILLACVGMALIGFGEWNNLDLSRGWLIYPLGLTMFLGGLFLIWNDPLSIPAPQDEPTSNSNGIYLGRFELNGPSGPMSGRTIWVSKNFAWIPIPY
jgi:hypothetical protein